MAQDEQGESSVVEGDEDFPCWCGFFNADYICDEHLEESREND
jgi:hypothetical protein